MRPNCLLAATLAMAASCAAPQVVEKRAESDLFRALRLKAMETSPQEGAASTQCQFSACGGKRDKLEKTWNITESCAAPVQVGVPLCPTANQTVTPSYSGTLIFENHTRYRRTLAVSGPMALHLPAECVSHKCSVVAAELNAAGFYQDVTCASDGQGGCNCQGFMNPNPPTTDAGLYSISGTILTMTPDAQYELPAEADPFCIKDGVLTILINSEGSILTGR
jgi:hypothetical protein